MVSVAREQPEPIAVVGSGCRFPGSSSSPSKLWQLLSKPRDVAREIPDERFELKGYYHPKGSHHGTTNVVRSYMLEEDHRVFDANFFNISPNEADSIDPQQRLLMEVVYEALEAGGHAVEQLRGSDTCVYVGTMSVDYNDIVMRDLESIPTYFATGSSRAILSNRVSYFFDWHGPSMTIDTACSSSMVALHQGVGSLRSGESRVAVIGGTELQLGPEQFVGESKMNLLSPDGRSRMWDADANGYARGDGIAALVLKKLSDAIADGDHIECLIRGTGVNQDGKSTGLTVPSSEAQAALIRETYARSGLDISNSLSWPQFFEAHGTGTKAGDPREAAAIFECFGTKSEIGAPLYVGSVKTVIGHTEGTAGLAGVIKASLAVQHGIVPPNMLLQRLNPDIEKYYANLQVPTNPTTWPTLPEGVPRRASVNSFGFGGTNGHAIVEQYQPPKQLADVTSDDRTPVTPFTFSAATDETLVGMLQDYSAFLKQQGNINLNDLAWTLQSRKTALPSKISFSAATLEGLISKIDSKLAKKGSDASADIGVRSPAAKPRILGVFTGQGAQWLGMGVKLASTSAAVRAKMAELDQSLATLPEADRPSWTIAEALATGNLSEARFSQPLCTAVQVVLVDLLRSAGITFEAVIGHSSGEIAAAYAAGFVSAHDAVRIAFYRGVHAKHAQGAKGQKGAMMAVGTSWEDAEELLDLPAFKGRVKIAAQNSAASLTLSGDADAVAHAKMVFDEERKFARMLKVDTAYHSHHMYPCGEPYMASLRACGIKVNFDRDTSCSWYSSVKSGQLMEPTDELCDQYWRDNMVNAVLFADAVKSAADVNKNLAIEVGPHAALKGPASQTISDIRPALAYTGVLSRGANDVEAFSDALGFIWAQLGAEAVDFQSYQKLVSPGPSPKLVTDLPSYHWNHKRVHWHVSRLGHKIEARDSAFHELLGVPTGNSTDRALGWRNYLKTNEISWLDGHQLQGQTVFPAAGYVAMALEAGKKLAGERNVQVFEVRDLVIGKAITFDDNANFAAETLVTLTNISSGSDKMKSQTAVFTVLSCPNTGTVDMELVCKGKLNVIYGDPAFTTLSSKPIDDSKMTHVDSETFYTSLAELGYGYSGPFRTMSHTKRRLGQASAKVDTYTYGDDDETLMVHPSWLDVAFQASFLALSAPGDDQLWSLHVPTSIKCIRVNPELCNSLPVSSVALPLSSVLEKSDSSSVRSSVDIFSADGEQTLLQVEGLVVKPFSPATAADDRPLFVTTRYGVDSPNGSLAVGKARPSAKNAELAVLCERVASFYLRQWRLQIPSEQWEAHPSMQKWATQMLASIDNGRRLSSKKEWSSDDVDQINALTSKFAENADLQLISAIGEAVPAAVHGDFTTLSHMLRDKVDGVLKTGLGFAQSNASLARMTEQITFRYPKARVLEVGAGMGHATKAIFEAVGDSFMSYTYTDSSSELVEKAAGSFKAHSNISKMNFKVFDTENTPGSQDLQEHAYDVVIVSNPMMVTASFEKDLENLRRCLKPGGYLLMSGTTANAPIRTQMMMGGISNQWEDGDDGRKKSSTKTSIWQNALRRTGFSGVDTVTPVVDGLTWPFFVMAAQAVDDRITALRQPLLSSTVHLNELVILGNGSLKTSRLAEEISDLIGRFCDKVTILEGLPTDDDEIAPMNTFINLADLDDPIFKDISEEKMEGLKCLFELASSVLWVTEGARADEPYHNASIGFGRSITYEASHMTLQFLDVADAGHGASRLITEALLRIAAVDDWEAKGKLRDPILWSKEPELFMEQGRLLVPRLLNENDQNGRINSLRRPVTKPVNPQTSTVEISQSSDKALVLREILSLPPIEDGKSLVQISHSVLPAFNVAPETFLFLGYGVQQPSGKNVIALSDSVASKAITSRCVSVNVAPDQISEILAATASELLASSLISKMPINSHLLVHEADEEDYFPSVLARQAATKNINVTFSSTKFDTKDAAWIHLDPWTSEHIVRDWIPGGVTHFLDLAADYDSETAGLSIRECLPSGCRRIHISEVSRYQSLLSVDDNSVILRALKEAVSQAKKTTHAKSLIAAVSAEEIKNAHLAEYPAKVVDWTMDNTLAVQVQPINAGYLFSKDKTYLMAGLAGELGQSICEWMSYNGAGCIALTSRNPKPDEKWIASMKNRGTTVRFFAMDITKKNSVEKVVAEIKKTCPPIAGVANGAALFNDGPFSEMTLENFEKVLKPKIEGTQYLDDLFNDRSLEFFIVFSSIASIIGNSGQTHYSAANAFMTAVMSQRRKRGQAGTSLDIGRVAGVGYVERAGPKALEQLIRMGCMAVSERDIHQLFAEAIVAGAPDSGRAPIVTTGVRTVTDTEEPRVSWFDNPKFSHRIILESGDAGSSDGNKKSAPVRDQLVSATTMEAALEIIKDCFAAKLAGISQLPEVGHNVPLVELGIDSLVAVEVRSWFLKELKTDMPVLKVLGGGSVANLCEQALEKLPADFLPNVAVGGVKVVAPKPAEAKPSAPEPAIKQTAAKQSNFQESESDGSNAPSEGVSSGTRTPADTPMTQLSASSSMVNLGKHVTKKLAMHGADDKPKAAHVKSELMSFAQSRFWFLRLLIEDHTTFNIAIRCHISGNLRVGDLERAVRLVGNRHESLRTRFIADEEEADKAHQRVLPRSVIRLERKEISSDDELQAAYEDIKNTPYDIESGNLMRLMLLTRSPTEHDLLVGYHHILMDGVGFQAFLSDLEKAYQRQALSAPPRQLPAFSRIQREAFENGEWDDQITYWRNEFPDGHPILPLLPMAKVTSRMPMKSFNVHQVETRLKPELVSKIKAASKSLHSTNFHFYLAVFRTMLFRFTGAEDLTIGIADANRSNDTMSTVGLLLNLLTLRFKSQPEQKFSECVTEARNKTYDALENSKVAFDVLLKELNVPRSSSYSPFFQAFLDYRQGQQEKRSFGNTDLAFLELHPGRTAYDMTVDITEGPDSAAVLFRTQSSLYDITAAQLLLDTYVHLLDVLTTDASLSLKDTPLFSEEACKQALSIGRGPNMKSSWPGTLPGRIDQVAQENGEKIALEDGHGNVLTYTAMIDRIEAIAETLQKTGVQKGSRVLVFEDATADWPCSMLAIMRIGAVYVPLDLRNPLPRLAEVAESCQPAAILADNTTLGDAPQVNVAGAQVINVSQIGAKPSAHVSNSAEADAVAAILYTSGSTGKPKGIVVKHSGLRNEIEGYTTQWGLKAERTLQQSAFTFNHSSDQMYTGLVNGGSVYIVPWSKHGDPIEVSNLIQEQDITYTKATPAEYALWLDYGHANLEKASKWRFAFGGGEELTNTLLKKLATLDLPQLRFFNSYGPTEISISSTKMEIAYREEHSEGRIPCGYSLPNYVAYILDEQLKPVPVGMPGDLWIGGAGVSLGYLDNKDLTSHHFTADPFATPEYTSQGWTTMYRTGDIAHLQEDGAMVFHSRVAGDTQIKIRGLRIELGDIERNIVKAAGGALNEAVVTLRDGEPQFLVAHVVFAPNHKVADPEAFLEQLLARLEVPQYMVPVMAIPLDRMPLNNHSKVDRKALKALDLPERRDSKDNDDNGDLSETTVQLQRVWEDILNTKKSGLSIKPSTSFFTIGGNSLLIVRLQSRIRTNFNVTIPLIDLLSAKTLSDMGKLIEQSTNVDLIDWEEETALPATSTSLAQISRQPLKTTGKSVLVTGAGGFLGKHILAKLDADPDISKIHCIGLREKPAGTPRKLAISSPKIVTHAGDLSEPWLGLSETEFESLASEVDSILHMGAVRSFWDNYYTLRPSNVTPTKQLVTMAAARHIPIHYVSTAGVLPEEDAGSAASSVSAHQPPVDGSQGYAASRWASEQILEHASQTMGIPTKVHRFVSAREASTEATEKAMEAFLGFVDQMSLMPALNGMTGYFEMTAVDKAAGALATAVSAQPEDTTETSFEHHECEVRIDVPTIDAWLTERRGDAGLDTIPGLRFVGRTKALGLEYFVTTQNLVMQGGDNSLKSRR